jgi:hypothetical protein
MGKCPAKKCEFMAKIASSGESPFIIIVFKKWFEFRKMVEK